jgi:hypothetical protein
MVVNSVKHSVKSPVTMDYRANSVVPTRYIVYRKVTDCYRLDSFGIEFGIVTVDNVKHCVIRRLTYKIIYAGIVTIHTAQWSQWESIKLANYLN